MTVSLNYLVCLKKQQLCEEACNTLDKLAQDSYYHRTHNIEPILSSGRLQSLESLSRNAPDSNMELSVEPDRWSRERKQLRLAEAIEHLKEQGKSTDKIFLTKDGPLGGDSYGKYIIEKHLKTPRPSSVLNTIPGEHLNTRDISLHRKATVYVPPEEYDDLKSKYKHMVRIKSRDDLAAEELPAKSYSAFFGKLINNLPFIKQGSTNEPISLHDLSQSAVKRLVSRNAVLVGSGGLGLNTKNSDTDILVPYSHSKSLEKAKARFIKKFGLVESPYNTPTRNRIVLTNNDDVDLTLALKKDAGPYLKSFKKALSTLTDEKRNAIRKRKEDVSNSFFFPETRYKRLKRELDKELKIQRL